VQNLHQSTWDHDIVYSDTSPNDEELETKPFCGGKNTKVEGG
jgi:hypothetical protein